MADLDRLAPLLPFKQGERVRFQTPYFEGTGRVVGLMPLASYQNFGVVVQHEELRDCSIKRSPYTAYSTVVVPLYEQVAVNAGIGAGQTVVKTCVHRF
jgi:hypothetical protein